MGVTAMLAIGVDWLGKPIKNRKFRPRIYRFEDEQNLRPVDPTATLHSADQFALPQATVPGLPVADGSGGTDWESANFALPESTGDAWELLGDEMATEDRGLGVLADIGPDTDEDLLPAARQFDTDATLLATAAAGPPTLAEAGVPERRSEQASRGERDYTLQSLIGGVVTAQRNPEDWNPGDPVWAPTSTGMSPPPEVAQRRFWRSTAAFIGGARWYGDANLERLHDGEAPQRRNRRSGHVENLQIDGLESPNTHMALRPHWPDEQVDPFQ